MGRISGIEYMWPLCSKPPLQVWQGFKQINIHLFLSITDLLSVTYLLAGGLLPKMFVYLCILCVRSTREEGTPITQGCAGTTRLNGGIWSSCSFFLPPPVPSPPSLDRTSELASTEEGWKLFPMAGVGKGLPSPCGYLLRTSPTPTEWSITI